MPEGAPLQSYATVAQFRLRAPQAQAFVQLTDALISATIEERSRWLDGYLSRKFVLPLITWQSDLTQKVIDCVAYDVMMTRGFNPDSPSDAHLRMRFEDAQKWADKIPLGTTPMVVDSSGATKPGINATTPTVTTATQRGFSSRPTQPWQGGPPIVGDFEGN